MNRKFRAYFLGLILFLFISVFSILLFAGSKKSLTVCHFIKSKEHSSCPYIQKNLDKQRLVCPYLKNQKEGRTSYKTIKLISS